MPGSVASSPHRTPEMIWTSPCRHSKWWGQSWDLSEPFWGRRGGSWLLGSGAYRAFRGNFLFWVAPVSMLHGVLTQDVARSPHLRSPPMRVLTVLGLLAGAIGSLNAQRGGQVAIGGSGGYKGDEGRLQLA